MGCGGGLRGIDERTNIDRYVHDIFNYYGKIYINDPMANRIITLRQNSISDRAEVGVSYKQKNSDDKMDYQIIKGYG